MARKTPANRAGIMLNSRLKMTGDKSVQVLGSSFNHYKDRVWLLAEDDSSECPYFKSEDGEFKRVCLYFSDFTPINKLEEEKQTVEVENDVYTTSQRHAVKTFSTMLERATAYRETGNYNENEFYPRYGICDNVDKCRPQGSSYEDMYRVKDNVICLTPSFSGNYHYPVQNPSPRDGRSIEDEAEVAWDNNELNKWDGAYGGERVKQLSEILEHVKHKWDESLVSTMTPAQRRGINDKSIVVYIPTNTFWTLSLDDDTSSPYFIPLGNTGTNGRECLNLRDIRVMSVGELPKRSVQTFINKANTLAAKREKLEVRLKALQAEIDALKSEEHLQDYYLAQQHKVQRIKKSLRFLL